MKDMPWQHTEQHGNDNRWISKRKETDIYIQYTRNKSKQRTGNLSSFATSSLTRYQDHLVKIQRRKLNLQLAFNQRTS